MKETVYGQKAVSFLTLHQEYAPNDMNRKQKKQ